MSRSRWYPHIEVNVPTTAARAKGTLDLQNLGACLVLDHESGGRWRWWRQWWWRWWRSWHEIAQIATITEHNLKTFRFWAARSCLHSLSPHFSSDSHLAHVPPIAKKILIFSYEAPISLNLWAVSRENFDFPILKISPLPQKIWFKISTWAEDFFIQIPLGDS